MLNQVSIVGTEPIIINQSFIVITRIKYVNEKKKLRERKAERKRKRKRKRKRETKFRDIHWEAALSLQGGLSDCEAWARITGAGQGRARRW